MFAHPPTAALVRALFALRSRLDPPAARSPARRRTDEQLDQMRAALEGMREHGLASEAGQAADQSFHRALLAASGNLALASLASSVGAAVQWTTHFKQRASKRPRDPLPEHEAVYRAIAAGDAEQAGAAMVELLRLALEDMAAALP
jgi:DNA-binding FadR family transcriptional regulator